MSLLGAMSGGDYIENSREFLGLVLALAVLVFYTLRSSGTR